MQKVLREWKRRASAADFVWLARFRILFIYSALKFGLILLLGFVGFFLHSILFPAANSSLFIYLPGVALIIIATSLVLLLGLGMASRFRISRITGISFLLATDIFTLLAVLYACILQNMLLLLVIIALIACTTPLLIERINRYAKRYIHQALELIHSQNEHDKILQHSQELSHAIEKERSLLQHELHNGLIQDLSVLQLQLSILLKHNGQNNILYLNKDEVKRLKNTTESASYKARKLMQDLHNPVQY